MKTTTIIPESTITFDSPRRWWVRMKTNRLRKLLDKAGLNWSEGK